MARRGEGRPLHACVIVHACVHTMPTSVLSFAMFTETTGLCNSIKDCLKLEMSQNNDPEFLPIHQGKVREMSWNCVCLKCWEPCMN